MVDYVAQASVRTLLTPLRDTCHQVLAFEENKV